MREHTEWKEQKRRTYKIDEYVSIILLSICFHLSLLVQSFPHSLMEINNNWTKPKKVDQSFYPLTKRRNRGLYLYYKRVSCMPYWLFQRTTSQNHEWEVGSVYIAKAMMTSPCGPLFLYLNHVYKFSR